MIEKDEKQVELPEQDQKEPDVSVNTAVSDQEKNEADNQAETDETEDGKLNIKKLIIVGVIFVVAMVVLFICLYEPEFERVHKECVNIAGVVFEPSDDSFTIDTYSEDVPIPNAQSRALEAIQYANKELGFSDSLYSRMMKTTWIMGRQSEENDDYRVSWTYSPYDGLEVTYKRK